MAAETVATWLVDGHIFTASASLSEEGELTLSLKVPAAFMAQATAAQRRLYAQRRDIALGDLADALSQQACGESEPHHTITH